MDWLIIDSPFLCHRAFHSRKGISHEDHPTGTIYGFLTDLVQLSNRFMTTKFTFCWDSQKSLRQETYPNYRSKRKSVELSEEQKQERNSFHRQVEILRDEIIPEIGWKNNFYQEGYEADDLIASVVKWVIRKKEKATIVSADKDLYQLLKKDVIDIYNPITKVIKTEEGFTSEFGIPPMEWVGVKSIAGCESDSIEGIEGVGELTAARYMTGKLVSGKKFDAIEKGKEALETNVKLICLPYPGTKNCIPQADTADKTAWEAIVARYGMHSLKGKCP